MNDRKQVRVVPYDETWPEVFRREHDALSADRGPTCLAIHHVGSTSVPGLSAKPVIDIVMETPDLALIDGAIPLLQHRGYEARGEYGIPGRRYFSRLAGSSFKVHLHVFQSGDPRIARHLVFRDFLRTHPPDAARYGELKTTLAREHVEDPVAYQAAKAHFIDELQARALEWERGESSR
jgi:GrpB-like predicted nucleotidyltransferase (UPF0157 family)